MAKRPELVAARFSLDLIRPEEISQVAVDLLLEGYDSPSLRVVAGLTESPDLGAPVLLRRSLSELKVQVPGRRQAVMTLAREIAREMLRGGTSPDEGAEQIWDLSLRVHDDVPALHPFIYVASEWNDRSTEEREVFAEGVLAAAKELVEDG